MVVGRCHRTIRWTSGFALTTSPASGAAIGRGDGAASADAGCQFLCSFAGLFVNHLFRWSRFDRRPGTVPPDRDWAASSAKGIEWFSDSPLAHQVVSLVCLCSRHRRCSVTSPRLSQTSASASRRVSCQYPLCTSQCRSIPLSKTAQLIQIAVTVLYNGLDRVAWAAILAGLPEVDPDVIDGQGNWVGGEGNPPSLVSPVVAIRWRRGYFRPTL
jgi:hypothetical protein